MPKSLEEIKNLSGGTILNVDEKDTSRDTSTYALNINPNSQDGVLEGINTDKTIYSLYNTFNNTFNMIGGRTSTRFINKKYNNSNVVFKDFLDIEDKVEFESVVEGVKGIKEKILFSGLSPVLNPYSLAYEKDPTAFATFTLGSLLNADDTELSYVSAGRNIASNNVTGNLLNSF